RAYFGAFKTMVESGRGCTEAVVMKEQASISAGSRFLFDAEARLVGAMATSPPTAVGGLEIARHLIPVDQRPGPAVREGVAYLPILPRITLFIIGSGHV